MQKTWFDELSHEEQIRMLGERLKLQVDLTIERELPVFLRMGLKDAKTVLDLGTGNGYFLNQLARRFPDKNFAGLEANEALAETAIADAAQANLSNISFVAERCPWAGCKGRYDFIFSRLALYCMPERKEVLEWARDLLVPGGRVCIADLDDGWIVAEPTHPAWDRLFAAIGEALSEGGADRFIGRKLPNLLHRAGFVELRMEMHDAYSSWAMGHQVFCDYYLDLAHYVHIMMGNVFDTNDLANFEKFIDALRADPKATVFAPIMVVSGKGTKKTVIGNQ